MEVGTESPYPTDVIVTTQYHAFFGTLLKASLKFDACCSIEYNKHENNTIINASNDKKHPNSLALVCNVIIIVLNIRTKQSEPNAGIRRVTRKNRSTDDKNTCFLSMDFRMKTGAMERTSRMFIGLMKK